MEDRDALALQRASKHSGRRTSLLVGVLVGVLGTVAVFTVAGYGPRWSGERAHAALFDAASANRPRPPFSPAWQCRAQVHTLHC